MNRDQNQSYQIEQVSTKSDTQSGDTQNFAEHRINRFPLPKQTFVSMKNTRRAIMNDSHFASVARKLRPNCFEKQEIDSQQYKSTSKLMKEEKENKFMNPFVQENPEKMCCNIFSGSHERNFAGFKPANIFESRFKPNWEVEKLVDFKPTIKAFDILSNPFHFLGLRNDKEYFE